MMKRHRFQVLIMLQLVAAIGGLASGADRGLEPKLIHLRSGADREWSEFPETPQGKRLDLSFEAEKNTAEQTLVLRQQDVKQVWNVLLNGKKLGELSRDENDTVVVFAIPSSTLVEGKNALTIEAASSANKDSDDIRVGQITLIDQPLKESLFEATIDLEVIDADSMEPVPCRITIVDSQGALQSFGTTSGEHLAVRPGVVYTSNGKAKIELPAGHYTVFAGRGFEYSLAKAEIMVAQSQTAKRTLLIRREVPTAGYVACDTHIHTLTHSGHGDCTIDERMITIAGEGIELPIATDHNKHIDYSEVARKMGVQKYFTPVVGNEVTTARGHFNIFPIAAGASVVDHKQTEWGSLFDEIFRTPSVKAVILNHARDLHSGVRPFGPDHFNSIVGQNLDDWPMRFNAMEVINSGATQTDPLRLFHDWMALVNAGYDVTPVGSSDSHDVSRYVIGQGRTYIRCDDRDPAHLPVDAAMDSFVKGHVMVSYGLLTELIINKKYQSGDTAKDLAEQVQVDVRVLGPHWTRADQVQLFANGHIVQESRIESDEKLPTGTKWIGSWTIPKPAHDVHLVAIATGPGIDGLYWKTAKPYQPESPDWTSRVIGCSGAVWIDADNDGRRTSAREYTKRVVADAGKNWSSLFERLSKYDQAVAAQAAHLVRASGTSLQDDNLVSALKKASGATQAGFQAYREAWRENEIARGKR